MMARKEEEKKPPTLATVIILAVLTVFIGAAFSAVSLASQAVVEVGRLPDPEERKQDAVYLVKGAEGNAPNWRAKWALLERTDYANTVSVTERELNAWAKQQLKLSKPEQTGTFSILAGPVNFRVTEDNLLQLATEVEAPGLFAGKKVFLQLKGRVVVSNGKLAFHAKEGFLGKAPLGYVPVLNGLAYSVVEKLFRETSGALSLSENSTFTSAVIEDGKLILQTDS